MKRAWVIGGILLAGAGLSFTLRQQQAAEPSTGSADKGIAVVELFTSEGCSSCPPADAALMELVDATRKDGRNVYALSFHVDYWNRLGWKDPFSNAAWSERQRSYADRLPGGVYTPQCVVNGNEQFVGSDREALGKSVAHALATAAPTTIEAQARWGDGSVEVDATITGDVMDVELVACLTEDGLSSDVRRGENSGKRLAHVGVVRDLSKTAAQEGHVHLRLEASSAEMRNNSHVIVFAQLKGQGKILGATEAHVQGAQ